MLNQIFFYAVYYVLPFLVVVGISYILASLLMRAVRHKFTDTKNLFISSFCILFIFSTLLSWSLSIDLFFDLTYRPIEFLGIPFIIPNVILIGILYFFARKQVKVTQQDADGVVRATSSESSPGKIIAIALVALSIVLLVLTRAPYFERFKDPVLNSAASLLNMPQLCESIKPYSGLQPLCVLNSLNVDSVDEVDRCQFFSSVSRERVGCINAKAVRNDNPDLCKTFSDDTQYSKNKFIETYKCLSKFEGTDEWLNICKSIAKDYPNKPHLLQLTNCLIPINLEDGYSDNEMLSYTTKQSTINSERIFSIQYESIPRCDSFTSSDTFTITFGDNQKSPADCKGVIEHEYRSVGQYQVNYIKNGNIVSSLDIEVE